MKRPDYRKHLWKMLDGSVIPVQFMSDEHIERSVKILKDKDEQSKWIEIFSTELVSRLSRPKPVYHAHPMTIYNTSVEDRIHKFLTNVFGNTYVCPNRHIGELNAMKPYLMIVERCSIVVASENKNGYIARGTFSEIDLAQKNNIPVFVVRRINYKWTLIPIKMLEINNPNDWKFNYGKIITY